MGVNVRSVERLVMRVMIGTYARVDATFVVKRKLNNTNGKDASVPNVDIYKIKIIHLRLCRENVKKHVRCVVIHGM